VNVGSPLYKIDVADSVAASAASQTTPQPPAPVLPVSPPSLSQTNNPHGKGATQQATKTHAKGTPSLIHFVGKREHVKSSSPQTIPAPVAKQVTQNQDGGSTVGVWTSEQMADYNAAWLGRPSLSSAEIEAIESGGATLINYTRS
jgi:hypothetical protein